MSFACHIWEYPAPRDTGEVELIREAYSARRVGQNPRFIELAKRLTARYPCITTLHDDAADEGVWSDGPLDGRTDEAVYSIGIRTQFLDTVYPFVVDTANALGLNVYDDASGTLFRSDGNIYEHDPGDGNPRRSSSGIDLDRLTEHFAAKLAPVGRAHGFERVGCNMVRGVEGGWQALAVRIVEFEGRVILDVAVDVYFHEVSRLYHELDPQRVTGDVHGRAFSISVYEFFGDPGKRLWLDEHAAVTQIARFLPGLVAERLMPMAHECSTLGGLDEVMNSGRTLLHAYPLNSLIVARLVCSRRFDALYDRFFEEADDRVRTRLSVARAMLWARFPCADTFVVGSIGPDGPSHGVVQGNATREGGIVWGRKRT